MSKVIELVERMEKDAEKHQWVSSDDFGHDVQALTEYESNKSQEYATLILTLTKIIRLQHEALATLSKTESVAINYKSHAEKTGKPRWDHNLLARETLKATEKLASGE